MKKILITAVALSFITCTAQKNNAQKFETVSRSVKSYQDKTYQAKKEAFVNSLLAKMTLDEKIGQLNLPSSGDFTTGQAQNSNIGQKLSKV